MKRITIDSNLSLAILGLLAQEPMSGYGLRKVFLTTAMKAWSDSPGAIYPALRRLRKDGLIEGTVQRENTLRPREVFALTRRGRAGLVASLTRPVTREDVVRRTDGLFLRFSLMSGLVGRDGMLAFLRGMEGQTEDYLKVLEAEFRRRGPGLPFSGRAALERGVEDFRATVRWVKKTRMDLAKLRTTEGE